MPNRSDLPLVVSLLQVADLTPYPLLAFHGVGVNDNAMFLFHWWSLASRATLELLR